MSAEGPKSYPVVYDPDLGLQYSYQTGYLAITIPPSTDVTVGDINSEAATNGQALTANGSGGATWTTISSAPGGTDTQVQFNQANAFGGSPNFTFDYTGLVLALQAELDVISPTGGPATIVFKNDVGATMADIEVVIQGFILNVGSAQYTFYPDGSFLLSPVATDPGTPQTGAIWYNSTSNTWKGFNGTSVVTLDTQTPSVVDSSATSGGAAAEEVTVAGLLTTSTIWAVTQKTAGGAALPLTGWTNVLNGSLNVTYSADMGPGAVVRVVFIP